MHALLEAAAEPAPLLVVVEDCHWADQSTRDLLSFLFSRPFEGPVAVVASYRSDDLHRRHPLRRQVAEWTRLRGVERIQLSPLPDDDVRALVAMLAPSGLSDRELETIVGRAEGNAFFVEELVGAAGMSGDSLPDGPRRRPPGPARPARRPLPAGGAGRERRRPQGRPRPARRDVRPRRAASSRRRSARPSR